MDGRPGATLTTCPNCGERNPARARFCLSCGTPLGGEGRPEARKLVSVLFSDVTGSTALGERLDPESLSRVMARWYHSMREVIERHGGTVEKFIGDAVMAVFGIPVTHEDDALRAVRAAAELPQAMAAVNSDLQRDWGVSIQIRTGVNSGEVMTGNPDAGDALVLGDPVNVAARLEQAASPGEVLIGGTTWELVRDAVQADPVPPLTLKGKSGLVPAWRLRAVTPDVLGRARLEVPLVDRVRQLRMLRDTFDTATENRACWLFTLLGQPGIGKSRLVTELMGALKDEATILHGRCLPYGEGITYRPIAEAVRQAAALVGEGDADSLRARLATLLEGDEHRDVIVERLAGLIGLADGAAREEIPWAVRRLLEVIAQRRPVVLVLDDLHWAEPALLDLVEHVSDWARDVPLLLLCIGRPELTERRPMWGAGRRDVITLMLEPLGRTDSEELIERVLGETPLDEATSQRLVEMAEGNPLFLQELVAVLVDRGLLVRSEHRWTSETDLSKLRVPTSIASLLGARLDQLDRPERDVLGRASVAGQVFYRQALSELTPASERGALDGLLQSLVRRDFIRSDRSYLAGQDAFRFRHVLIRDVAYESLPKGLRAELHERFAAWLQGAVADRIAEYQGLVGHHLRLAYGYRAELGPVDDHARELARSAADWLARASRQVWQADRRGAARLLREAIDLLPDGPERAPLLGNLGFALLETGAVEEGDRVLAQAAESIQAETDPRVAWRVKLECTLAVVANGRPRRPANELRAEAERALKELTELGDDAGLARTWYLLGEIDNLQGHLAAMAEATERAAVHARRAGALGMIDPARIRLRVAIVHGPVPVEEGIRRGHELLEQARGTRRLEAVIFTMLGRLEAMRGRFDEARKLHAQGRGTLEELGLLFNMASAAEGTAFIEGLAGNLGTAERELRESYAMLSRLGNRDSQTMVAAELADVLWLRGQPEEALQFAHESEQMAASDDLAVQIAWRKAKANLLADEGSGQEAERLAREAVRLVEQTDFLQTHGDALVALAEVLRVGGRPDEAVACLEAARQLYEQKGNSVLAGRARGALAVLREGRAQKGPLQLSAPA